MVTSPRNCSNRGPYTTATVVTSPGLGATATVGAGIGHHGAVRPAARLLLIEADHLPVVLLGAEREDFDRPTVLPGWSIRDVLAHCAAILGRTIRGEPSTYTPEENQADVEERRSWPIQEVIAELVDSYRGAADVIDRSGGPLDGLGLGEWIHGGDIRLALGRADAYRSAGVGIAIELILERSRARLPVGVDVEMGATELHLGPPERHDARLRCDDEAALIRLVAGRAPDPDTYHLDGAEPLDLLLFH